MFGALGRITKRRRDGLCQPEKKLLHFQPWCAFHGAEKGRNIANKAVKVYIPSLAGGTFAHVSTTGLGRCPSAKPGCVMLTVREGVAPGIHIQSGSPE